MLDTYTEEPFRFTSFRIYDAETFDWNTHMDAVRFKTFDLGSQEFISQMFEARDEPYEIQGELKNLVET